MKDIEKKLENLYTKLGKAYYEGRFEEKSIRRTLLWNFLMEWHRKQKIFQKS